ncbi:MAG: DUF6273 domain-containing protein [Oscillospiraceae bacterium]|nr:DUF6273 domain-containing protein [Oscillospiraceae bacterium]
MKKLMALILALAAALTLVACDGGNSNGGSLDGSSSDDGSSNGDILEERDLLQSKSIAKGNKIEFGGIDWIVLEVVNGLNGKSALVLSDKVLEKREFDESSSDWETSDIRQYLNGEFYENTFSSSEKNKIAESDITNTGNNTKDRIFLLSDEEAQMAKYFASDKGRIALDINTGEALWWWLRSPGDSVGNHTVEMDGSIDGYVFSGAGGVRPALWLNL